MKITVTYPGQLNTALDDRIRAAMRSIGATWYAQGSDHIHHIRDLAFEMERVPRDGRDPKTIPWQAGGEAESVEPE